MRHLSFIFLYLLTLTLLEACGVKGPPLPPLTATPQQLEPSPSPRPAYK